MGVIKTSLAHYEDGASYFRAATLKNHTPQEIVKAKDYLHSRI